MDFRVRVEGDVKDPGVLYEIEQLQKALKEIFSEMNLTTVPRNWLSVKAVKI